MSTFWNTDNPDKPWGKYDKDAELDIPFNWVPWLTEAGVSYASHVLTLPTEFEEFGAALPIAGLVTVFIRKKSSATLTIGHLYPIQCRIITDGSPPLKDDRTVYLKAMDR